MKYLLAIALFFMSSVCYADWAAGYTMGIMSSNLMFMNSWQDLCWFIFGLIVGTAIFMLIATLIFKLKDWLLYRGIS